MSSILNPYPGMPIYGQNGQYSVRTRIEREQNIVKILLEQALAMNMTLFESIWFHLCTRLTLRIVLCRVDYHDKKDRKIKSTHCSYQTNSPFTDLYSHSQTAKGNFSGRLVDSSGYARLLLIIVIFLSCLCCTVCIYECSLCSQQ